MIGLIDSWDVEYNGTENEAIFKLVCDSAAELSSLTHYDSIKIRIGSECTDIATGDKYLKSSSAWVLQPSANQFENVYTKAQVDSMYNTLYQTMLYYHTTQTSTDGTITFYAFAGVVGRLKIYGNGQQTGTPTPDAPIQPEFVGVRTANLFDINATPTKHDQSTIVTVDGQTLTITGTWYIYYEIDVAPNTDYYVKWTIDYAEIEGRGSIAILTTSGQTIHNQSASPYSFNSGENQRIRLLIYSANSTSATVRLSNIMLNDGSTDLPYEPYGYKIPITCAGQTVPVYLGQVSTVRKIGKLVLDGTETIGSYQSIFYIQLPSDAKCELNAPVCTHFLGSKTSPLDNYCIRQMVTGYWGGQLPALELKDRSHGSVEDLKKFFAAQNANGTPVVIWYVLASEETAIVNEPLCKIGTYFDELHSEDAGVAIPTVKGSNTLTVDTDIAPSKIEISGER